MPYNSLAGFLEELAQCGQLARVAAEVDPALEIAEITRRMVRNDGPALLFERVRGQSVAVVTNLLGTPDRVRRALGLESLDEISTRAEALIQQNTPRNWFDRLKMPADDAGINKFRPKTVKSGPCGQVVRLGRDIDLAALPLVKQWRAETGASITAGLLITQDADSHVRGVTLCTLVALDQNRLAAVDDGHSTFTRHWNAHQQSAQKMPAVVVLGGDPALRVTADLALSDDVDFYHVAGLLRGDSLNVVKCRSHELEVPAEVDLVLEGYLDPAGEPAAVESAPTGAHFRRELSAPVLHVTAITHRTHPIFPVMIDCRERGEAAALGRAREKMLLPTVQAIAPAVVALALPGFGGPHRYAFVAIRKTVPFAARQVASALWGSSALRFTKFMVLLDHDVDVHDTGRVLAEVGANVAVERDVFTYDGPAHGSDHANTLGPMARYLGIDATTKIAGERTGPWPAPLAASDEIERLVSARWPEYKLPEARDVL